MLHTNWLDQCDDAAAVLVTVALTEGSTPRKAGAKMLVTATQQYGTIGGGHLELRACEIARAILTNSPDYIDYSHVIASSNAKPNVSEKLATSSRLERFSLGPSLGQCCGGIVFCAFELIDVNGWQLFEQLRSRLRQRLASWRLVPLDNAGPACVIDGQGTTVAGSGTANMFEQSASAILRDRSDSQSKIISDQAGQRWLIDPILPPRAQLFLFGAGHVGAALVRALAELPCQVHWIDERDELFPSTVPDNVIVIAAPYPQDLVNEAPAGASYLVMTHQHALDQRIAEAILRRGDSGWFGLIGSDTKRALFERRLGERGITAERLATMVCPIGLAGISDKVPAVIAASVAAQLLQTWEAMRNKEDSR